ncbi:MAG: DUF3120 domain-containing protein [Leptolyngbya sp. SIO4C1]|nr:DUF3120 domain-containing protein [Leptolyngbya sp. SIO4C1]
MPTRPDAIYEEVVSPIPLSSVEPRLPAFLAAAFLVSVPVFFQAPLVRSQPWLSLLLSGLLFFSGLQMLRQPQLRLWGDLAIGFTWTWLAGSLYWGWFRWEPILHLPMEAIGLPVVCICLLVNQAKVGSYFYLGSLLGTAITDLYFYWVDLIPYWRRLMAVDPAEIPQVLQAAVQHIQTPAAVERAVILLILLIVLGTLPMSSKKAHWWAFSGAVLSTILVDALFFMASVLA